MAADNDILTRDWQDFERGRSYNRQIDFYDTADRNERFYAGDQWRGVDAGGLPTPVFNIIKRVVNYYISSVASQDVAMTYGCDDMPFLDAGETALMGRYCRILTGHAAMRWEKLRMSSKLRSALLDAALSGDAACYVYWDPVLRGPNGTRGDFRAAMVDSGSVFYGDPTDDEPQNQPYIIISGRSPAPLLRREAEKNGVGEADIAAIIPDGEKELEWGDRAKAEGASDGKCTWLIRLWRDPDDGLIRWRKTTRGAVIRGEVRTRLTRYPLAMMHWDVRKNCFHGQSPVTGLIPNQLLINKLYAMVAKHMMDTAFSKVIYDADLMPDGWNNAVGEAIGINGPPESAVKVLLPGSMQAGVLEVIRSTMEDTKSLMGATDAALGEVRADNTSAIIAVQRASALPLESVKRRLYQFIEDIGLIWLDFMLAYYGERILAVRDGEGWIKESLPFSRLKGRLFSCSVDVSPSSYSSEEATVMTLDNLVKEGIIDPVQYLERLPDGIIPRRDELVAEIRAGAAGAAAPDIDALIAGGAAGEDYIPGGEPPSGAGGI